MPFDSILLPSYHCPGSQNTQRDCHNNLLHEDKASGLFDEANDIMDNEELAEAAREQMASRLGEPIYTGESGFYWRSDLEQFDEDQ